MNLHELPEDHPDRNRPLAGCFYRNLVRGASPNWREVKSAFAIAKKTYNQLGPAWVETAEFCWEPNASTGDEETPWQ